MGKSSLAPGFRFKPTDVELVQYYLKRKLLGKRLGFKVIAEVDIYKYDPWDLPDKSCWESGDLKWYFFCPREKKYRNGNRIQRATEGGYWKTTGKDRSVVYSGEVVGWIRTLIFHTGRAPRGERTNWVMHEYRLEDQGLSDRGVPLDSYVICMIFQKDGLGPKIGAQYGAPFKEEDWTDDEAVICSEAIPHENMSEPNLVVPSNCNSSITTSRHSPKGIHTSPYESCISDVLPPSCNVHQLVSSNHVTMEKLRGSNDDLLSMLNCFTEGSTSLMKENDKNEELGNVIASGNASATPNFNSDDIYEDLGDLGKMARVSEDGYNFSNVHNSICAPAQMQLGDNEQFLELDDLSW